MSLNVYKFEIFVLYLIYLMNNLPECAKIIEKLNNEYDELYNENQKTKNQNNVLLNTVSEILLKHIIEAEDLEYQINQMYDIIESLTRHESYDIMYYFKRHYITDITIQILIINKLLLKIQDLCVVKEKCKYSTEILKGSALHTIIDKGVACGFIIDLQTSTPDQIIDTNINYKSLDKNMNTHFTIYISEYNLDPKDMKFTTRCLLANPYWDGIIEGRDDYNIYFNQTNEFNIWI